jgi:Mrp family chromosome partitioning ATPase
MRTLGGILAIDGIPDVTRMGWPTLRSAYPSTTLLNAIREMRETLAKRSAANAAPLLGVIGADTGENRTIAALNFALAAARDGARVLLIDADRATHALSNRMDGYARREVNRLGWLSFGTKASPAIKTANGISILPSSGSSMTNGAIRKAIAQARSAGDYDLVIADGPALPWSAEDRELLDLADGLAAILPTNLDINDCMETIIAALDGAEHKLIGVILNELHPVANVSQRNKQYA